MRIFDSLDAVKAAIGEHNGYSDWHTVTQEQINAFAEATGDHQWIHVDVAKAAEGPFGSTIAHGFLTVSLIPMLGSQITKVNGIKMGVNYGLNKVRFPSPVPVGSKIRAGSVITSAEDIPGGLHLVNEITIEREGGAKPCCIAETVVRYYA